MKENSIFNESTLAHSKKIEQIICKIKFTKQCHLKILREILEKVGVTKRYLTDQKLLNIINAVESDSEKEER